MNLLPELEARRAFRAISPEPVEAAVVGRILEAAFLAPSCMNRQPWRIVAVRKGDASHQAVAEALTPGNSWGLQAPLFFVLATKPSLDCRLEEGRDYAFFDLGQAALALQLQATREGLYAHPVAGYAPAKVKAAVNLPEDFVPLCVVIAGLPGDPAALAEPVRARESAPRSRKPLSETAFAGTFGAAWQG